VKGVFAGALLFVLLAVGAKAEEGVDALFETEMTDIHGKPMVLAHLRGKPLIVNFWTRACLHCRDEFPVLTALQAKHRGLVVLGVAREDDPAKVREFLTVYKMDYLVTLVGKPEGAALMQGFGNEGGLLPFTLLVDRKGEVVFRKYGIFKESDFQAVTEKLLR
jgi:thiol-disulfide isomerase/thioredoxin